MASMSNGSGGEHAFTSDMDRYGPSIDAETAQRLLDGEVVGPPRLASLLASVAYVRTQTPTGPLPGEERAVAAFRAVGVGSAIGRAPVRHHEAPRRHAWSRALAIKVAVAVFVLSGGGVAVAAATGVIPSPIPLHAPVPRSDGPQPGDGTNTPNGPRVSSRGVGPSGSGAPGLGLDAPPSALPADINGLCHAWADEFGQDPATAEHNPRYAGLIAAAGGVDKVTAFCQAYLASRTPGGEKPSASPSDQSTQNTSKGGH
jgi:hypothetical protein